MNAKENYLNHSLLQQMNWPGAHEPESIQSILVSPIAAVKQQQRGDCAMQA